MTRRTKIHQDPRKLLRSIVIVAGAVAAAYAVPKAVRFVSDRWQDADYAEEHHAMAELTGVLEERKANARKEGFLEDPNDPFVQDITKELKFRKKRHATEKKKAKCHYCEAEQEK